MLRVPIRYKVAAAMACPLLLFVAVMAIEVRGLEADTAGVHRQTELATATDGPTGLLNAIQDERNWATVDSIGQADQVTLAVRGYGATRKRTDAAVAGFRRRLAGSQRETRDAFAEATDRIEQRLTVVRDRIDRDHHPHTVGNVAFGNQIFEWYADLIDPFFAGTADLAAAVDHPELRHMAELIDGSIRQIELIASLAREVTITAVLSPGGIDHRDEITKISGLLARFQRAAQQLQLATTGEFSTLADDALLVDFTNAITKQVDAAMTGRFELQKMLGLLNRPLADSYTGYENRAADALRAEAARIDSAAIRRQRLYMAAIGLTIVLALAIMVRVSRSITRPLGSLTEQAVSIARHRLGDAVATVLNTPLGLDILVPRLHAVEVDTVGEVAEVANVVTTVQETAVDLAMSQVVLRRNMADAFTSLGRRNQNLLSRQMDFITALEQSEADPDALGQLFMLDHLATRMRRNAESLLVLAGDESPRRWTAPVRMTDVVRAAIGEVEDYTRVGVLHVERFTVAGTAAADLTHLLAELIENALQFSPRHEVIEVRGFRTPGGYMLTIVDAGVGMTAEELDRANRRVANTESYTVAPSKYLGHYVAGRLAVRHGIEIHLQPSLGRGTTVLVQLPASLLAPEPERSATGPTPVVPTHWHSAWHPQALPNLG
jgi:signal transduction histidine kinase